VLLVVLPPAGPNRWQLLFLDEMPYALPPGCVAAAEVTLTRHPPGGPRSGVYLEPTGRRLYHLHPPAELCGRLGWVAADCYTARSWDEFDRDHPTGG
jgi:hypothetical protein